MTTTLATVSSIVWELAKIVLPPLFAALAAWLAVETRRFVALHKDEKTYALLFRIADAAVRAAEQLFGSGANDDKYRYAEHIMETYFPGLPHDEVEFFVEAAVQNLPKWLALEHEALTPVVALPVAPVVPAVPEEPAVVQRPALAEAGSPPEPTVSTVPVVGDAPAERPERPVDDAVSAADVAQAIAAARTALAALAAISLPAAE